MSSVQFSSISQSCPTLCNPMDCSTPGFPVLHHLPSLLKLMPFESVMPSNRFVLCRPLLLLPSIFPSIRVFSNEPALHIRWPKYWSFSFSMSPSNEYSGLISFRIPGTVWKGKLYGSSIKFIIPDVIIRMAPWDCLQIKKNPLTLADC